MNITLCAKSLRGLGGQETFVRALAGFLVGRGHAVKAISAVADPLPGVDLRTVAVRGWLPRGVSDWECSSALARELRRGVCDVSFGAQKTWGCNVIRPGGGVEAEYWADRLTERCRSPLLARFLGRLAIKRHFDLMAERRGYASTGLKRVIANSTRVKSQLIRHFPRLQECTEVIYNGVDPERFRPENAAPRRQEVLDRLGLEPDALTAIFVAHNFKLKGLRQAIEAVHAAVQMDAGFQCQLIVVGGGRQRGFAILAEKRGLREVVRFTGATLEPERFYAAADFLLLPTFYDPCANVTLEALAAGIPVVTTRNNGAHELITHGRDGWVVDNPRQAEAMAECILEMKSGDRVVSMKMEARRVALEHPLTGKLEATEQVLLDVARQLAREATRES